MQNATPPGGPITPNSIVGQQGGMERGTAPAPTMFQSPPNGGGTGPVGPVGPSGSNADPASSGYYSAANPFSAAPTAGDDMAGAGTRQDRYWQDRFGNGGPSGGPVPYEA